MKKTAIILAFVSISFTGAAQVVGTSAVPPKPMVKTEDVLGLKESEYDFGKIPQGKPVTHVFAIENTGKDSLKIENVQASCGCTTPEWDRNKIYAPGEKGKITVGYNAASEGPFTKSITISYNGSQNRQVFIKGEVWKTPASSAPENKDLKALSDELQ